MPNPLEDLGVTDEDIAEEMKSEEVLKGRIELAERAAEYWRSVSPVDTGEYVKSIGVTVHGDDVSVGSDDNKAEFIEYGTGGDSPTPEFAPRAKTQAKFARRGEYLSSQ